MQVAVLDCETGNIGDYIQSHAVKTLLNRDVAFVPRERLNLISSVPDPIVVVMNGWFMKEPRAWPPHENVKPVFFGFHITPAAAKFMTAPESLAYFKKHQPIGCRDQGTAELLSRHGIKTFVSGCATFCYPEREHPPVEDQKVVYVVDIPQLRKHKKFLRKLFQIETIEFVNHEFPEQLLSDDKFYFAEKLIEMYRNHAAVVITRRLHCALPCTALGIPVMYFGNPDDYRVKILPHVGVEIHPSRSSKMIIRTRIATLDRKINAKFVSIADKFESRIQSGKAVYNTAFKSKAVSIFDEMISKQFGT